MTPDEALAALDALRCDREAGEAAVKATPDTVVEALKAGLTAAEIARRLVVSEGYVRKFRRQAKLQDPRYAHLKPPAAPVDPEPAPRAQPPVRKSEPWAEPSPLIRPLATPSDDELPPSIRKLPPPLAAKIVGRIRKECPTWHSEAAALVTDAPPLFQDLLLVKRAADAGILDDLGIELP